MQLDGSRIRAMREYRELTQGQLAYKAQTTVTQISRLENDERPGAQAIIVARIAAALGTTVDYLIGLTDDSGIPPLVGNGLSPAVEVKKQRLVELLAGLPEPAQHRIIDAVLMLIDLEDHLDSAQPQAHLLPEATNSD